MKQVLVPILISAALAGACASPSTGKAVTQTRAGFADAALSPLEDLNLRQEEIPNVLEAIDNPYDVPTDISCAAMEKQVAALNRVLPPDWDAAPKTNTSTLSDKAADTASDSLLDVVADEARGLIPYRGWVRRLSGANSYDKKLKAAYEKGAHRRTYLKALGEMKGCTGDARPSLPTEKAPSTPIQYRGDDPEQQSLPVAPFTSHNDAERSGSVSSTPQANGPRRLTMPQPQANDTDVVEEAPLPEVAPAPVRRAVPTGSQPTGR